MPVIFVGHGSPENAVLDNSYTQGWKKMAELIPTPKAILCISAHWITTGKTKVAAMKDPKIIYDFYGFPEELYKVKYPVRGDPALAKKIKDILKKFNAAADLSWGIDHGTWSVLVHMYPKADIPTLQLSIDYDLPVERAFEIGKALSELRNEGVLIIGSGNVVHNLRAIEWGGSPFPWAVEFDDFVKDSLKKKDYKSLINFKQNKLTQMAHPTHDHYLPLIYAMGASEGESPKFFNESIFAGSVSMRCVIWK